MARTSVVLLVGEQTAQVRACSLPYPLRCPCVPPGSFPGEEDSKKSQKRFFSVQPRKCSLGPMATEKAETDRVPVTLALSTISYLEKLVRQGTHGTSVPGVAKTLIEEGIRLAIKDGLLAVRDNSKVSTQER